MSAIAAPPPWTEEELLRLPHEGKCEMVNGELIMAPAGYEHESLISELDYRIRECVRRHKLGEVCGSSLGCRMVSGNVLCPDLSFISAARIPARRNRRGFFQGAPDLVVEVLSPWDRSARMREKLADYFASGARLAWVIDPEARTAEIHRATGEPRSLGTRDALEGEDVVPGFTLPLAELFAGLD